VAAVSDSSVDFDIDLGPMGKPRQRIEVQPAAGGTQVVWTMQADMGLNPIGRVMGLFMDRIVGPTFEVGLKNLSNLSLATARS
jgi:Polyketide cyclase / dehydrase and lipid transport